MRRQRMRNSEVEKLRIQKLQPNHKVQKIYEIGLKDS